MEHLITSLLVLIVVSRLLGRLFVKYNQPEIIGEILAGIILGPSILNFIQINPALDTIAELAVFLVILSAGLEMNFKDVVDVLKGKGLIFTLLGFFIPLFAGVFTGVAFGLDATQTIFLGLCASITALPVAIRMLESFDIMKTDIAKYTVATAIVIDLAALLALGVILDLPHQKSFVAVILSVGITSAKLIFLAGIILLVNFLLEYAQKKGFQFKRIPERIVEFFGNEALFGIVIAFVLIFGTISETLGFHYVIGAFFGALLIDKDFFFVSRFSELENTLDSVTNGFLGPVFFATLGLKFDLAEVQSIGFIATVIVLAMSSKVLAGWAGGLAIGLKPKTSISIGIILNSRGVMDLVIASIALKQDLIGKGFFSTLILLGIVSTMITPTIYKKFGYIAEVEPEAA